MKINNNFFGMKISSQGMGVQRKRMNLIAENIANTSTTKTAEGTPYKRKFLVVKEEIGGQQQPTGNASSIPMNVKSGNHIPFAATGAYGPSELSNIATQESKDNSTGDIVYMPGHPDANEEGYVEMPNVNVITEMVEMISASRSYEANLTTLNSAKQMVKDTLEI